jgi:hypothetical protein
MSPARSTVSGRRLSPSVSSQERERTGGEPYSTRTVRASDTGSSGRSGNATSTR